MTYDPYALAFPAATFQLTSPDFTPGGPLPAAAYGGDGPGISPRLSWHGLPEGTRSVVVTAYDADAPIPGGFWHWAVKDVPADAGGLPSGAGTGAGNLPAGAVHLPNDLGRLGYAGVNPPPGTGTHRVFVCATALDVDTLEVPPGASLAMLHILMIKHTLGRAVLTATSHAAG